MRLNGLGGGGLAVALFAIGAFGFYHYGSRDDAVASSASGDLSMAAQPDSLASASSADPPRIPESSSSASLVAIPANLPPVDPVDPPELRSNLPADQLFAPDPAARAHWASKLSFGVDDRHYVEFNRAALTALKPGSMLAVRLPDTGEQVRIQIDGVEVHPNADKSWTGRVIGAGRDALPVLFTQGADASFGSIQTRGRTYTFEADGRMAWIADANVLRRHQDFSQSDVRIPDPRRDLPPPTL